MIDLTSRGDPDVPDARPLKGATDFEDTAAVISELDAVIAIDSSSRILLAALASDVGAGAPDARLALADRQRHAALVAKRCPAAHSELGVWVRVIKDLTAQSAPG